MADLAATAHVDTAVLRIHLPARARRPATHPETRLGVSVRGALAMVRAAKVWAASAGPQLRAAGRRQGTRRRRAGPTGFVIDPEAEFSGATAEAVLTRVLAEVAAPQQRAAVG